MLRICRKIGGEAAELIGEIIISLLFLAGLLLAIAITSIVIGSLILVFI